MEVMEHITIALDNATPVDVIYLDFKKAFDTVPHERLLLKLQAYGIIGNVNNWVRSFLSGRNQRVKVNDAVSGYTDVRSGIPQGSILGPVLFTIFINDLPTHVNCTCKIFADDTKVFDVTSNNVKLQKDLNKLQEWSELWQLLFNVEKCKVLHMGNANPNYPYTMTVNGVVQELKVCTEEKDLGVTFDPKLTFDQHIKNVINKANSMLGIIKRTFTFLSKDMFLKLYKALVRPHLEYGNTVWSPLFKRQSVALERVQRRATRLLKECEGLSYCERLHYLNLHSLKGRRLRGDLIETFKLYHGLVDAEWDTYFSAPKSDVTRNADGKIFVKYSRTNLRKNSYSNRVVHHWNKLPGSLKNAKTLNNFKNLLDANQNFSSLFYGFDE
jgi:hypothetical protein